jgi:hypothetical protein
VRLTVTTATNSAPIILRFTAGHWQKVPSPARTSLTALAMTSSSAGWAAGPANFGDKGPLLRWTGKAWVSAASALPAKGDYLAALAAGSKGQVWGVGVGSISRGAVSLSMRWTGQTWQEYWLPASLQPAG